MSKRPPSILKQRREHQRAGELDPTDPDNFWRLGTDDVPVVDGDFVPRSKPASRVDFRAIPGGDTFPGWPQGWMTPPMEPIGQDFWSGYGFSASGDVGSLIERMGVYMSAVDLVSKTLASQPWYTVDAENETIESPTWMRRSPQPERYPGGFPEVVKQMVNSLLISGELIILITSRYVDSGLPRTWTVLNPRMVDIDIGDDSDLRFKLGDLVLPRDDIKFARYETMASQVRGIAPLNWMAKSMLSSHLLDSWADNAVRNGATRADHQRQAAHHPPG